MRTLRVLPVLLLLLAPAAAAAPLVQRDAQLAGEVDHEVGPLPAGSLQTPHERIPRQCFVVACVEAFEFGVGNVTPSETLDLPPLARVRVAYDVGGFVMIAQEPSSVHPERQVTIVLPAAGPVTLRVCPAGCAVPVAAQHGGAAGFAAEIEAGERRVGTAYELTA